MISNPAGAAIVLIFFFAGATVLSLSFSAFVSRLRDRRLVRSTPVRLITAALPGWVAFRGTTQPRAELRDPVMGKPCYWWRCVVQRANVDGAHALRWWDNKEIVSPERLGLTDGTSQTLIDPSGAEYDARGLETFVVPLDDSTQGSLGPLLASWGFKKAISRVGGLTLFQKLRVRVQILQAPVPAAVWGTLSDGVVGKAPGKPLVISFAAEPELPVSLSFLLAPVYGLLVAGFGYGLARGFSTEAQLRPAGIAGAAAGIVLGWYLDRRR